MQIVLEPTQLSATSQISHYPIPVYRPYLMGREKEYVIDCMDSSWISSRGPYIDRFEREFGAFIGVENVTTVTNGTVALHVALLALDIGPGDEVIVPTLTYIASANAVSYTGAKPVFVDCLPGSWQIDPEAVKRAITERTKAVMVVHLYGAACDMDAISQICRTNRLKLIEDCAEAIGTKYRGSHVGSIGDISTFSFFGNKTITTGEGGVVASPDRDLLKRCYALKTQGVSRFKEYWHDMIGYNYRMTNLSAAIGVAQLEYVDHLLARKSQVARWYDEYLEGLPISRQDEPSYGRHSWWMYSILANSEDERDRLRGELKAAGVETRPTFNPIHMLPPHRVDQSFPVAEDIGRRGINLPSFPGLVETEVRLVAQVVRSFYEHTVQ